MPIVTTAEVIAYTEVEKVKTRAEEKLAMDIRRAEQKVRNFLGHLFEDTVKYPTVPEVAKDAILLYAEYYARLEINKQSDGIKSETFDDYSYTKAEKAIQEPDALGLLLPYIAKPNTGTTKLAFKLRGL